MTKMVKQGRVPKKTNPKNKKHKKNKFRFPTIGIYVGRECKIV